MCLERPPEEEVVISTSFPCSSLAMSDEAPRRPRELAPSEPLVDGLSWHRGYPLRRA